MNDKYICIHAELSRYIYVLYIICTNIYIIYQSFLSLAYLIYHTSPEIGGVLDGYISVTFGEWCPQRGFPKIPIFAKVTATCNSSLSYFNFHINKIQQVDFICFYLSTFFCASKTHVFSGKKTPEKHGREPMSLAH